MIISKKYADKLIKNGKANIIGKTYNNGKTYLILNRYDLQRTDHVCIGYGDLRD